MAAVDVRSVRAQQGLPAPAGGSVRDSQVTETKRTLRTKKDDGDDEILEGKNINI